MRILMIILLVFGLAACTSNEHEGQQQPEGNHSEQGPEEDKNKAEEEDPTGDEEPPQDLVAQIREQVVADFEVKLPEAIRIAGDHYLSASVDSDMSYYEVQYYETNEEIAVNDAQLAREKPIVIVKGTVYTSAEEAHEQVGYQPIQEGMPEVDLLHEITGYQDAGAGSSFITWHEGRWSFMMRSRNEEEEIEVGKELAQSIVEKLETEMLPPPHENGAGMFSSQDSDDVEINRLAWQEENLVYEVYMADPLELIELVATHFD